MDFQHIEATFGKLEYRSLSFSKGLNIIEAPNESGKSTLLAFLRVMLYGFPPRERGALADKNRYAPWSLSPMRGTLALTCQKGNITLQRDTARANSPMGRFSAVYTGSGEAVDGLTAADCGETLLGVPCEVYERSAFIRQSSLTVDASTELERRIAALITTGEDVKAAVREYAYGKCEWVFETPDRHVRQEREAQVKDGCAEHFAQQFEGRLSEVADALYYLNKEIMRKKILEQGIRPDGRGLTDVRPIWCEVGILPRTHGSAIFTRGETQALTVTTLGSMSDVQILDGLGTEDSKRYIHHYNMPPYATGEAGRMKSPGRREIGHGALAERALEPVVPGEDEFPYALRLVSEILSSNGSSSMASVCGSTLSLMDAGVPIKRPVAGVAMGLIKDAETGKVAVLTDIQGLEDFLGDMDFKVAGTVKGITAIQMDIKIAGIDRAILEKALNQALAGRLHILKIMLDTLGQPREHLSKYAPKIVRFTINPEKIREVIGPGGKMINKIIAETGVKIDIEDDGRVYIATPDEAAANKARKIIEGIAKDVEVGDVYLGKVVRIMNFGAFIELTPGKDGMLHISKMADHRVEKVEDVMNIGDEIEVKVNEIDSQGRVNLIRNDITYPSNEGAPRSFSGERRRPPRRDGRPSGGSDRT